jgi:hypothetical protein
MVALQNATSKHNGISRLTSWNEKKKYFQKNGTENET